MIDFGDLHIFFIVGYDFTGFEISIIADVVAEPFEIGLVRGATFDAGGILHGDAGQCDIFIDKRHFLKLSFLVDAEHDFGLDLGKQIDVTFKAHVHILVFLRRIFEMVNVVFLVILGFFFSAFVIILMLVKF